MLKYIDMHRHGLFRLPAMFFITPRRLRSVGQAHANEQAVSPRKGRTPSAGVFVWRYGYLSARPNPRSSGIERWELVLITEGHVTYWADGQDYHVSQGSIILARPGFKESYHWDPLAVTRHAYFHFFVEAVPADWPDHESWPIVCEKSDPAMVTLFEHIIKRIKRHSIGPVVEPTREDCRIVETLMSLFITDQNEEAPPEEPIRPEPVSRAIKWMRELIDETPLQIGHVRRTCETRRREREAPLPSVPVPLWPPADAHVAALASSVGLWLWLFVPT